MDNMSEKLKKFENIKLVDIVKNYKQYGYSEEIRESALKILGERGISYTSLKISGNLENKTFKDAGELYDSFLRNSALAFVFYVVMLITKITLGVSSENLVTLNIITHILAWASLILFFIFLVRSFIDQLRFYKTVGKDYDAGAIVVYFLLGMPLYLIMYFYFKRQMADEVKLIK